MKGEARGSTGRGITPAYLDEVGQFQIYYADFLGNKEIFAGKMRERIDRVQRDQARLQVASEHWLTFFDTHYSRNAANTEIIEAGLFTSKDFDFSQFSEKHPSASTLIS